MQGAKFEPTDEQRRLVHAMSGLGIPQQDIATHLKIDAKTLRLHFRHELDQGSIDATIKVSQSLFQMATTGKNVAAAIFWMKARAGWREKQQVEVEHSGEVRQSYVIYAPRECESVEEWEELHARPALERQQRQAANAGR